MQVGRNPPRHRPTPRCRPRPLGPSRRRAEGTPQGAQARAGMWPPVCAAGGGRALGGNVLMNNA